MTQKSAFQLIIVMICVFLFNGNMDRAIAEQVTDPAGNVINVEPTAPGRAISPDAFGPNAQTTYVVSANAMAPLVSDTTWSYVPAGLSKYRTGGSGIWFQGQVHIPSGAKITYFELNACDITADSQIIAYLHKCPTNAGNCTTLNSVSTGTADTPGCGFFYNYLTETVDNWNDNYTISVAVSGTTQDTTFQAVRINYSLQISPAPGTATFIDVPVGSTWFQYVEALAASGITTGYGDGTFRPDNPVTRGQMAAFFSRALGLNWPN